jgi:hypothetical protein
MLFNNIMINQTIRGQTYKNSAIFALNEVSIVSWLIVMTLKLYMIIIIESLK